MKREIFILADYANLGAAELSLLDKCDRLALTPSAMLALEEKGISYFTCEVFYSHLKFREDTTELINETVSLFSILDKKYEAALEFPRPFTGNIYFFMIFFMESLYIAKICSKLNKAYDKAYIAGSDFPQASFKIGLGLSFGKLNFSNLSHGLKRKLQLLRAFLSIECASVTLSCSKESGIDLNPHQFVHYFLEKIPRKALKLFGKLKAGTGKKKAVFVIQDEYEVDLLKKHMSKFHFLNPVSGLLKKANNDKSEKLKSINLFTSEIEEFTEKWFPDFKKHIFELFAEYHKKIVCSLDSFSSGLNQAFDRYKPTGLFYSMCSTRVYEDVCAHVANQRKIPVFYFQHAGTPFLIMDPTEEICREQNKNIKKINIFQSKIEKKFSIENFFSIFD